MLLKRGDFRRHGGRIMPPDLIQWPAIQDLADAMKKSRECRPRPARGLDPRVGITANAPRVQLHGSLINNSVPQAPVPLTNANRGWEWVNAGAAG
jgi:hypothetical protein